MIEREFAVANNDVVNTSIIESDNEKNGQYAIQFEKASEILDLCCMQLNSVAKDIEGSSGDLTDIFFAITSSVKTIQLDDHAEMACADIMDNMRQLTIAFQANDEYCQRLSHLQNTLAMLAILIRSTLLRELSSEWEELYNSILANRSIKRQHEVFQAAVQKEVANETSTALEDDYELF